MNFSFCSIRAVAFAFKWLLLHGNVRTEIIPECFYKFLYLLYIYKNIIYIYTRILYILQVSLYILYISLYIFPYMYFIGEIQPFSMQLCVGGLLSCAN